MEAFRSPLSDFRPRTSASVSQPEFFTTNAIDTIYLKETTVGHSTPMSMQRSTDGFESSCFTSEKKRTGHYRISSAQFRKSPKGGSLQNSALFVKELSQITRATQKIGGGYRRKIREKDITLVRDLRCRALNKLVNACNRVESSKELNSTIQREKNVMKNWSRTVDRVTKDLQRISDCTSDIVQHLYYYNKFSNDEIYKEINRLKEIKVQPSPYSMKLDKKRRSSLKE